MRRIGKHTWEMEAPPWVESFGAVCGKKEGDGPLGDCFDRVFPDTTLGEDAWEQAESALQQEAVKIALTKGGLLPEEIGAVFAGDLQSQCGASVFAFREFGAPFLGQFSACATMGQDLLMAAMLTESGGAERSLAVTSSHFCSAERQFRSPLEYGGQRPPTAQWTVTAAGAVVVASPSAEPHLPGRGSFRVRIRHGAAGRILDMGVKDAGNMGAAMAPAAADTLLSYFRDTGTGPWNYERIFTGDLGQVGSALLQTLLKDEGCSIETQHQDCGLLIFNRERQDVHAGGSGCGCSSSVLCGKILPEMRRGELREVLFLPTGALLSLTSTQQGETIPAVAHLIHFSAEPLS